MPQRAGTSRPGKETENSGLYTPVPSTAGRQRLSASLSPGPLGLPSPCADSLNTVPGPREACEQKVYGA